MRAFNCWLLAFVSLSSLAPGIFSILDLLISTQTCRTGDGLSDVIVLFSVVCSVLCVVCNSARGDAGWTVAGRSLDTGWTPGLIILGVCVSVSGRWLDAGWTVAGRGLDT